MQSTQCKHSVVFCYLSGQVSILIRRMSQLMDQHDSKHSAHLITSQSPPHDHARSQKREL